MKQIFITTICSTIVFVGLVSGLPQTGPTPSADAAIGNGAASGQKALSMQTLFDMEQYKKLFNKNYATQLEETTRKIYLMNSAFLVYIKAVAYQFWRSSSYESLNHLSDLSPLELDMMRNKMAADWFGSTEQMPLGDIDEIEPEADSETVAKMAKELEEKMHNDLKEAHLDGALVLADGPNSSGPLTRRKREIGEAQQQQQQQRAPRRLTLDKLIHVPGANIEPESAKIEPNPESNNPNYDPLAMELDTRGLNDQLESVHFHFPKRRFGTGAEPSQGTKTVGWNLLAGFMQLKKALAPLSSLLIQDQKSEKTSEEAAEQLPDAIFLDHRDSGCLAPIRDQYLCGSCYAFAGIALVEFLYCKHTGKLVEFSEQYLVDCGRKRFRKMDGCNGGIPSNLPSFIHNFGLELRSRYPYLGYESDCPYEENLDLAKTGFIRMPLKRNLDVPRNLWEKHLESSPLYVVVTLPPGFSRYGGGVESGEDCPVDEHHHAMLLVGHGREDGQEYWLMRNSYGLDWGVAGHFKLAKSAPKWCIQRDVARTYGSKDGIKFDIKPVENELNRDVKVELDLEYD